MQFHWRFNAGEARETDATRAKTLTETRCGGLTDKEWQLEVLRGRFDALSRVDGLAARSVLDAKATA